MEAENFGPDDPRLAISLNNLANLYRAQDRHDEAEAIEERAKAELVARPNAPKSDFGWSRLS